MWKCARRKDKKDEDMRRDKSVRGCDERETKCTGTTDEPHLIVERMRRRNMKTGGHERKEETEVCEGERMKGEPNGGHENR